MRFFRRKGKDSLNRVHTDCRILDYGLDSIGIGELFNEELRNAFEKGNDKVGPGVLEGHSASVALVLGVVLKNEWKVLRS